MLEDARLFTVDTNDWPSNKTKSGHSFRNWHPDEQVIENLRLPFDTVAIEWYETCVAMRETVASSREYLLVGSHTSGRSTTFFRASIKAFPQEFTLDSKRLGSLVDCHDLRIFNDGKEVDFAMSEISLKAGEERELHTESGTVTWEHSPRGYAPSQSGVRLKIDGNYVNIQDRDEMARAMPRLKEIVGDLEWSIGAHVANIVYLEVNAALMCLLAICEPSRFIVEQSLADAKPYKGAMIQRSPYRPHYIALKPGEIKKRYLYDEHDPTGVVVAPHERRGHFRKLTSEKFISKRGHVIWIKPCWVGKTEGVRGKNKYVVRLDL